MPRAWMSSLVAGVLAAVGIHIGADGHQTGFVVPNVPDLTIETRETIDLPQSTVQTTTLYFKGAWQRRDLHLQFPSALPGQRRAGQSTIVRCDERRTLELNHDARLYGWAPLTFTRRHLFSVGSRLRQRPEPPAAGADVKIVIETVDTGERRQVGSYSARRVITTTTTVPGPGAHMPRGTMVQDGWHIDLPPAGCWNAGDEHAFLIGSVVRPGEAPDRIHVEVRGGGRRGFPIEETTRRRSEGGPPVATKVTLIEFSDAVLDASLFDVPAGYRPALPRLNGGFDITKPDTVANRLAVCWDDVTTMVRGFLGF